MAIQGKVAFVCEKDKSKQAFLMGLDSVQNNEATWGILTWLAIVMSPWASSFRSQLSSLLS